MGERIELTQLPARCDRVDINKAPGFDTSIVMQEGWKYTNKMFIETDKVDLEIKHDLLANTEMPKHNTWELRVLVRSDGSPVTARYITKNEHAKGIHVKPRHEVDQLDLNFRPFREPGWSITSEHQPPPSRPGEETRKKAEAITGNWLTEESNKQLESLLQKARRDTKEGTSTGHRTRLRIGTAGSEIRISPNDYIPEARELVDKGWTLIRKNKQVSILDPGDTSELNWGFKAEAIRHLAQKINWPDKNIQDALAYGFEDHSESTL